MIKWLCPAHLNTDFLSHTTGHDATLMPLWCHFVTHSLYLHTLVLSPVVQLFSPLLLMICLLCNVRCFCLDIQHVLETLLQADSDKVVCRDYVEFFLKCTKKYGLTSSLSAIVFLNFIRYWWKWTPRNSLPNNVRKELQMQWDPRQGLFPRFFVWIFRVCPLWDSYWQ